MVYPAQIFSNLSAPIRINAIPNITGTSTNIYDQVNTALQNIAESPGSATGISVPVKAATSTMGSIKTGGDAAVGIHVTSPLNYVKIFNSTTKEDIVDGSNREVFGRVTVPNATTVTLTYFVSVNGADQAHTFATATTIDILLPYRFDFARFPADALLVTPTRNVSDNSAAGTAAIRTVLESLTVSFTASVLNPFTLLKTPSDPTNVILHVNGVTYDSLGASPRFTVSGKTVTWSPTNGTPPFQLNTTYKVTAQYTTTEA